MGPAVWDELAGHIQDARPDCGAIDSGYAADQCYAFSLRRDMRWLLLTKGVNHQANTPFLEDPIQRKQRLRKRRKKGFAPFLVGNVAAMALITQRLNLPAPVEGCARPGYLHFPKGDPAFDDEFFRQLASSAHVEIKRNKKSVFEWSEKATHPRNEAFDCWKLALAAVRLSGVSLTQKPVATDKESLTVDPAMAATINNRRARFYVQKG